MNRTNSSDIELHFRVVDRDGNGLIDFEEFRLILQKIGSYRSNNVMLHAFNVIDSDGNGQIDLQEFSIWWSRQTDPMGEAQLPQIEDSPEP